MSSRTFLSTLFADVDGGVVECRSLPSKRRAWTTPGAWSALGDFVDGEVRAGQSIYIGVATRIDQSAGTISNLCELPALFVDLDCSPADVTTRVQGFPFKPSLQVSSGLGAHLYWKLKEPLDLRDPDNRLRASSVLRRLCGSLHGDDRACDLARVLRLPGTLSFKYDAPRAVTLLHTTDTTTNLSEFEDVLPREVVRKNQLVLETAIAPGARNDTLYKLTRSLRAKGLPIPAIVKAVESVNTEQCDPPLPGDELQELIRHALSAPDAATFTAPAPVTVIHDAASNGNGAESSTDTAGTVNTGVLANLRHRGGGADRLAVGTLAPAPEGGRPGRRSRHREVDDHDRHRRPD